MPELFGPRIGREGRVHDGVVPASHLLFTRQRI